MSEIICNGRIPPEYSFIRQTKKRHLSREECFKFQIVRFSSFKNLPNDLGDEFDPIDLSAQGFYFDVEEAAPVCCVCHEPLRRYRSAQDDPQQLHYRDNPSCPVAHGNITENKPLEFREDETDSPLPSHRKSFQFEKQSVEETSSLSSFDSQHSGRGNPGVETSDNLRSASLDLPVRSSANPPPVNTNSLPTISDMIASTTASDIAGQQRGVTDAGQRRNPVAPPAPPEPQQTNPNPHQSRSPTRDHTSFQVNEQQIVAPPRNYSPSSLAQANNRPSDSLRNQMFTEQNRFLTFQGKWNYYSHIVRAEDLAKNGFFYHGPNDRVMCVFCFGILSHWSPEDRVEEEHARHFHECTFVTGSETRNIPSVRQQGLSSHAAPQQGPGRQNRPPPAIGAAARPTGGAGSVRMTRRPLTTSPEDVAGATHTQYADETKRLRSFDTSKGWPVQSAVTPQNLAAAGFFYTGQNDNVRCFFCDGGLRNWEEDDDPWVEHARWFPRCSYLNSRKDQDFIENVSQRFPVKKQQAPSAPEKDSAEPPNGLKISKKDYESAVSMGFNSDQIKQAVENHYDRSEQELNMQSLTEALLALVPANDPPPPAQDSLEAASNDVPRKTKSGEEGGEKQANPQQNKSKKKKKKKGKGNSNENSQPVSEPPAPPTQGPPAFLLEEQESRSLSEENRQLKEQRLCKVCMDEDVSIVFLPCGHLVCCATCAPAMRACPICRALVRGTIRTYLS